MLNQFSKIGKLKKEAKGWMDNRLYDIFAILVKELPFDKWSIFF